MSDSLSCDVGSAEERVAAVVDEFMARVGGGERPDVDEYVRRHPEMADVLRQVLPAVQMIRQDGASGPQPPPGPDAPLLGGTLGDFRIVREVGRGGMGVVYEAEQLSLRRRVALKVLPLAGMLDPRQLQRFRNEAQAAACLHHTSIVPVYFVGEERGVHFYAMQFIDGRPLSDLVRQLRQAETKKEPGGERPDEAPASKDRTAAYTAPAGELSPAGATVRAAADGTPLTGGGRRGREYHRRVAELGAQAAEALDHAHQLGIVHRDVKPANLLLDSGGRLWVADFGLAQVQQGEGGLTLTGDLVGTLRYMSPEQALAKRVVIDHRTDVYSLGATLYELLTLRPAFSGSDRQELLRQIAFEEPVRPRRLEKAVPAELEIIVQKALEKNPAERYGTAKELADDLRRWLEDKPIRARRPSLKQVAARWARRHRTYVVSAAAVLVMAAVLGGGTWLSWEKRRLGAEADARAALGEATRLLQQERWPEAISAARRAKVVLASVGADANLRRQVEELSKDLEMAQRLQEALLRGTAVKDGHFDWEEEVAAYAQAFREYGLDAYSLDPREAGERIRAKPIHRQLVEALDRWTIEGRAAGRRDGEWAAEAARAAAPEEWRNRLRDARYRRDGKAIETLLASVPGDELPSVIRWAIPPPHLKGITVSERAITLLRQVQERNPDDFWANHLLAEYLHNSRPPRPEEAIPYYTAAVALRPQSPGARLNLGTALRDRGDLDRAIAKYREAIHLKEDYAEAHFSLGYALVRKGRVDEAVAEFREAVRLKEDYPEARYNLGVALQEKGRLDEAIAEYRKAVRLKEDYPEAHCNLGVVLQEKGRLDEAVAEFRTAIRLKGDLLEAHCNLGGALREKGRLDEAMAAYREALRVNKGPFEAHFGLGNVLQQKGRLEEAIAEYRKAIRLKPDFAEAHYNLGATLALNGGLDEAVAEHREAIRPNKDYFEAHFSLGIALALKGLLNEAITEYREAIRLNKDYFEAHFNLGAALARKGRLDEAVAEFLEVVRLKPDYPQAHYNLGLALADKGRLSEAVAKFLQAIRIKEDFPEAHYSLGNILLKQGRFREAVKALRRGHELGSRTPGWRYPSAQWLGRAEHLAELDDRLSAVLEGKAQPKDAGERVAFARLCQKQRKRYAAAERFYQEAFASQPTLAENHTNGHRYDAACAAALAGCGQGKDAAGRDDKECARLRKQALDWLHADLSAWQRPLDKDPAKARPSVAKTMQHWLGDEDFAGVRGAAALGKLPEAERPGWQKLWEEVEALKRRAANSPAAQRPASP